MERPKSLLNADLLGRTSLALAGRAWPKSFLERMTQGAGSGLISGTEDLFGGLHRLAETELNDTPLPPRTAPWWG